MIVVRDSKGLRKRAARPVVTLGNFDGLHLGHQKIIRKVAERARMLKRHSVVYTFEPHPLKVVAPEKSPPLLIDTRKKAELISGLGIDFMVVARFTRGFAAKHPREFVEEEILSMGASEVWVGHDFSFGRGKAGTVGFLKELGSELGFRVRVIPAYKKGGGIVSSSRIRRLVGEGRVEAAGRLLGRPYSIRGSVVKGKSVGKRIGFPTANLKVASELIPGNGIYAAWAVVSGRRRKAVVNIGTAPTFGGRKRCVEVHVMGFEGDLYGDGMEVEFVRRLRGERAFPSVGALQRQIGRDIERALRILKEEGLS